MKVLLVQTTLEFIEESFHDSINAAYPLGLAYLHSYLEDEGHEVCSLNLTEVPFDDCSATVLEKIKVFSPGLVGFQILTSNRVSSFLLIERLRESNPSLSIVVGGIHVSETSERIVERFPHVIAVLREGETPLAALLTALQGSEPLRSVKGIAFHDGDGVVTTEPAPVIDDLDLIPFPKHESFLTGESVFASMMTSRGCPFTCSFCSVARRKMRFRSVANVVDEIEYIARNFPQVEVIRIWDDQFFYKVDRVIAICDEIVRRRIKMKFICMGRLKPCTRELVLALERAGFIHVLFGLETGSVKVLELCNKKIQREWALETAALFRDSSIAISMFLIVGLHGEDADTILESARFVQRIQRIKYFPCWYNVGIATIYPGTDLYDRALGSGMIKNDFWDSDEPVPLYLVEHTHEELSEYKSVLLRHVDPLLVLSDASAFEAQREMLPYILRFVLESSARQYDPYVSNKELLPFLNLIARLVAEMEREGELRLLFGAQLLREARDSGAVGFARLSRVRGSEVAYVLERSNIRPPDLLIDVLREECRHDTHGIIARLCRAVERHLEERFYGASVEIADVPPAKTNYTVSATLSPVTAEAVTPTS